MSSVSDRRRRGGPELSGWQLYVWDNDEWVRFGSPSYVSGSDFRTSIQNAVEDGDAATPIGYSAAGATQPTDIYQPTTLWVVKDGQWVWTSEQNMWESEARSSIEEAVHRGDAPFMAYEGPGYPGSLVVFDGRKWSLLPRM